MIEVVNGYICMNCCDVDKARLGQDPHQSTNQIQKQIERLLDKGTSGNFGPAVTFGGSLQATASDQGAGPSKLDTAGAAAPSSIDLLA